MADYECPLDPPHSLYIVEQCATTACNHFIFNSTIYEKNFPLPYAYPKCENATPFTDGSFTDWSTKAIKTLSSVSMVCSLVIILTYWMWRPLRCYSRQLVLIIAFVQLYLDSVLLWLCAKNVSSPCCCSEPREASACLWMGFSLNIGYTSLLAWNIVIYSHIHSMATTFKAEAPSKGRQALTHVVVWGTVIAQAVFPFANDIIGYIGRPWNGCGYCIFDDSSIEHYGDHFQYSPSNKHENSLISPTAWVWLAGAGYGFVCCIIIVVGFVWTLGSIIFKLFFSKKLHKTQRRDLKLLLRMHIEKLSVLTILYMAIALCMTVRIAWSSNPIEVYKNDPNCKLSFLEPDLRCFPEPESYQEEDMTIIFNRDTAILSITEAILVTSAGIINFLLFCVFSQAFRKCFVIWVGNLSRLRTCFVADNEDLFYVDGAEYGDGDEINMTLSVDMYDGSSLHDSHSLLSGVNMGLQSDGSRSIND